MTLAFGNLIQETTSTTGTGTLTLSGAVAGYQSFAAIGNANTTYYTIRSGVNKEVGIGTYTASGTTLSRDTVLYSTAGGTTKITVAAGATVISTYPAETSVSGGGGGTYPTVQPSLNLDFANTRQLDPRITFVRNSTAAYYDGQTSAVAEQNLLLQSQAFDNSIWGKTGSTIVANSTTAPDGTTTGDTLSGTASGYTQSISQLTSGVGSSPSTFSCYLNAGTISSVRLLIYNSVGGNNFYSTFDLSAVTSVNFGVGTTSTITQVGSTSWYRCTVTGTAATGSGFLYSAIYADNGYFYIWGAQLEQRSSVTAYNVTTTAAITNYIPQLMTAPAGVARFDCDPLTRNSLGLLIEESRTNLLTYSSEISSWPQGGANTIVSDCIIAPDGTLTGDSLYTSGSNIYKLISVTSGTVYTRSVYAKKGTSSIIGWEAAGAGAGSASFNFDTLAVTNNGVYSGMSAVSVGNGWYRISAQITPTLTATMAIYQYGGANYGAAGDSYIWGAQLEAGSFATSYMPTAATTITRAADQASMTGTNFSSWYNQSQGSFYVEVDSSAPNTAFLSLVDWGTSQNNRNATSFNNGYLNFTAINSNVASMSSQVSVIRNNTLASKNSVSYTNTISFICKDGTATSNSSAGTLYNATNMFLTLGARIDYGVPINGHIRKLSYYPVALSSTNLVALTS